MPSSFLRDVLASFGIPARVVANTIDLDQFRYRVRDPLRPRLLSTRNFGVTSLNEVRQKLAENNLSLRND